MTGLADIRDRVDALMPELVTSAKEFTAIPSIAAPGLPDEPIFQAHDAVVGALKALGGGDSRCRSR